MVNGVGATLEVYAHLTWEQYFTKLIYACFTDNFYSVINIQVKSKQVGSQRQNHKKTPQHNSAGRWCMTCMLILFITADVEQIGLELSLVNVQ